MGSTGSKQEPRPVIVNMRDLRDDVLPPRRVSDLPPAPPIVAASNPSPPAQRQRRDSDGLAGAAPSSSSSSEAGDAERYDDFNDTMSPEEENSAGVSGESHSYSAVGRRKSVFVEPYNPEEDEDDEKPVIHPKSDVQRKALMEAVKEILIFRSLEPEQLGDVINAMFERTVEEGDYIIKQGDDGDNFYVIEKGKYNIFVNINGSNKHVGSYTDEGSFGELALMYNMPRAATIQAVTKGTLWAMDRSTFRRIVLRTAFEKRKAYESLLESVPLLSSLSSYERMNLADALQSKTFTDDSVIVRQGEPGDDMYFVEDGEVEISVVGNGNVEKKITTIGKGGVFGEIALVTHRPRAATAKSCGKVRVAVLDVNAFERLLGPCMDVMKRNIDSYEDQLIKIFGSTDISDVR